MYCLHQAHQRLTGKAGIAAQQNTCLRPAATDLRDNACHLLDRSPGGAVDVRLAAAWPPADDDQRRCRAADNSDNPHSRGKKDLLWLPCSGSSVASRSRMICAGDTPMRLEEHRRTGLDRRRVVPHLVIARRVRAARSSQIRRRLARQRRAVERFPTSLPASTTSTGSSPQFVVVVEVFDSRARCRPPAAAPSC